MTTLQPNKDAEVTISQQGTLKSELINETPGGAGTLSHSFTVPVGKQWLLKFIRTDLNSFAGTISQLGWRINPSTDNIVMLSQTTPSMIEDRLGEQNLLLIAGDVIRVEINISAYTSGSVNSRLLFVELDI